jgi:hypothetical protein
MGCAARFKTYLYGRSPATIVVSNPTGDMDVCLLCVLPGRCLCDELIIVQRSRTDCGASLCVIRKPRERGGHSPRWAAEPEKMITMCLGTSYDFNINTGETIIK